MKRVIRSARARSMCASIGGGDFSQMICTVKRRGRFSVKTRSGLRTFPSEVVPKKSSGIQQVCWGANK